MCSAAALAVVMWAGNAQAAPIDVSYTVSGSANNWLLDFTVTNNLGAQNMDVYLFGVQLPDEAILRDSLPAGYRPYQGDGSSYATAQDGGSAVVYNNVWEDPVFYLTSSVAGPKAGASVGGFQALVFADEAPDVVPWFAYAWGTNGARYSAGGNFNLLKSNARQNPAFEGLAAAPITAPPPVPEPATWGLMALGLLAVARAAARRQRQA